MTSEPIIGDDVGIPRPVTDQEAVALSAYLTWVADVAAWGRAGWVRVGAAKTHCEMEGKTNG